MSLLRGILITLQYGVLLLVSAIGGLINLVRLVFPAGKKSVSGEIVLITGAGSGLGRGMALSFARLGATIVAWDINKEANEATVQMIRQEGGKAFGFVCDCSKREDIYRAAQEVKDSVGHVTILVNNAGIVSGRKFLDCPDDLIQKTMDINTNAHFWTTKAFLPHMLEQNHGHLVSIASSAGLFGVAGLADYCASKFGALGFAEAIRAEIRVQGKSGVHVTCVCPVFINTGMFTGVQLKNTVMLDPDDVVREIVAAVQRNQFMLVIPRSVAVFANLKGLMPQWQLDSSQDASGVHHSMDSWVGRHGNKKQQ
ncbi:PREDICTED: epidermal retinol dehydrogenase 2-like [Branchiostoma belcheri]|uniref:Epidermal retinol dehydrogenase 2-like n=1 Tax=Branchiostoma belcheri TaxID=7741 RepID=A0A6P4YGM1_BRABE|nr:PREDICTED: epidermal retinol dehydrogenase 2-like [Branchiostoma belcheri]